MGRLGDILEAIYEAPRLHGALHARAFQVQDVTQVRAVHEWWGRRSPHAGVGTLLMATSSEGSRDETDHELWRQHDEEWRADADERVTMLTPEAVLTFTPMVGGVRSTTRERAIPSWDTVLRPRWLLDWFDLTVGESVEVANRSCWSVTLSPTDNRRQRTFGMPPWFGNEGTAAIDAESGVVLSYVTSFEGDVCDSWTTTVFEEPRSIDQAIFAFTPPDGAGFRDSSVVAHESTLRMASDLGVDLSDIDAEDSQAVAKAVMRAHHESFFAPPSSEELAQQYVPTASPPDDLDAAEAAVRDAFERIVTPSDDGSAVPAVEGGANLGPCLAEAGQRAPGQADAAPTVTVDLVKFLRPDEAVVWFSMERNGQTLLPGISGRARCIDGRWLVARETFVQIVGSVGVRCPPPPAT
jgi:hypothetical protein